MASSAHHGASTDRKAASSEDNTEVLDVGATFFREESGGSSVGNEDQDVASDPADGNDDNSEHAAEVSGSSDDKEDTSG